MEELYDLTLKEVADYMIDDIAKKKNVSKKLARKLLINSLNISWVYDVILDGVGDLLGEEV